MQLLERLGQAYCAIFRGHYLMLVFEPGSVKARCRHCGWRSPGFDVATDPPVAYSQEEIDEIAEVLVTTELTLHGGG